MSQSLDVDSQPQFAGHPAGLFVLFFAEMWERFSYYGMRALLTLFMLKGFLKYTDSRAYVVYGAYTALVYATPFIGGMLADRVIGQRRAVILGGLLMAAGHLVLTVELDVTFYLGLGLLIVGNGFFKPNISTMVGKLYPEGSSRRDTGFTLFYMGINLGAALAPLVCGYIGQTYGWHYGFGLATIGMMMGVAIFVAPTLVTQILIGLGSVACVAVMLIGTWEENAFQFWVNLPVALALLAAAGTAVLALTRGPLPADIGQPPGYLPPRKFEGVPEHVPNPDSKTLGLGSLLVYAGAIVSPPLFAALVWLSQVQYQFPLQKNLLFAALSSLTGGLLLVVGVIAVGYLLFEAFRSTRIERDRIFAILVLMFFTILFWAFFEQAGSSINNFTDRNVDRVFEGTTVKPTDVGKTLTFVPTQEQLGYPQDGRTFVLSDLDAFNAKSLIEGTKGKATVRWKATEEHVGMGLAGTEVPASVFQSVNAVFILLLGLPFTALWTWLASRRAEPNTAIKFALGILQLGLGFGALWLGAQWCDSRGMVWIGWLFLAYLLHTTGELCLSPVGLSMVTRLSPVKLVSTVMGAWFLATAFSQYVAGMIAMFTSVGHGESKEQFVPAPLETVHVYGHVFGIMAMTASVAAVILLAISPAIVYWMHEGEDDKPAA